MSTTAYQWINIIILFSFLGIVLKKKLGAYFSEQRKTLDEEMRAAGAEYARIQKEFADIQQSVKNLDSQITELKNFSLKEIAAETKRIELETTRVIQKTSVDSEARIKNEADRTKKILERELFESALVLARETLQKDFKNQNQDWVSQMVQPESPGKKNYAS